VAKQKRAPAELTFVDYLRARRALCKKCLWYSTPWLEDDGEPVPDADGVSCEDRYDDFRVCESYLPQLAATTCGACTRLGKGDCKDVAEDWAICGRHRPKNRKITAYWNPVAIHGDATRGIQLEAHGSVLISTGDSKRGLFLVADESGTLVGVEVQMLPNGDVLRTRKGVVVGKHLTCIPHVEELSLHVETVDAKLAVAGNEELAVLTDLVPTPPADLVTQAIKLVEDGGIAPKIAASAVAHSSNSPFAGVWERQLLAEIHGS
jgi:hypothetical protein